MTGKGGYKDAQAEKHPDYLAKCFITVCDGMIMGTKVYVQGRRAYTVFVNGYMLYVMV